VKRGPLRSREKKEALGFTSFPKLEDLQVGHYLLDGMHGANALVKITGISEFGRIYFYGPTGTRHERMAHNMIQVPLSFDVLTLLGFENIKLTPEEQRVLSFRFRLKLEHYEIIVTMAGKAKKYFHGEGTVPSAVNKYTVYVNGMEIVGCNRLHKLQTLYNGLTGEKLQIKTTA